MPEEDYDLAGFAVGVVDKKKVIDNTRMAAGDVVIALPSTGIHSNGFLWTRRRSSTTPAWPLAMW